MSVNNHGSTSDGTTHSMVKDGKGTLDLRTRPTRADLGMGRDGFVSYPEGTGGDPVDLTVELPDGTIRGKFFEIDAGVDGAFSMDHDPRHPPKAFDLFQHVPDRDAAVALLRKDATALGLTSKDIDDVTAQGTSVLQGLVKDWLSIEVQVRASASDDGSLNVIYSPAIDLYHNPAVDKVLHDGAMTLDLTERPTREELGFLPDYDSADITPEPGTRIAATVVTARGRVTLPVDSVSSTDLPSDGHPAISVLSFPAPREVPQLLADAGTALGFDGGAAAEFVKDSSRQLEDREFACSVPDAKSCSFRVEVTTATGEGKQVNFRLNVIYP